MQLRPKGLLSARGRLKVSRRRRPGDINMSGCARNAGRDMKGFWIAGKGGRSPLAKPDGDRVSRTLLF